MATTKTAKQPAAKTKAKPAEAEQPTKADNQPEEPTSETNETTGRKDPEQVPVHIALARVMADVKAVRKDGYNQHKRYNFRGIDGVMNAVGPALRTHGVLPQFTVELLKHEHVPAGTKTQTQVLLRYELNFLGPMCDSLPRPVVVFGEANDYQDKALAKAHSVAYRTALLQALCLPTDEPDPDEYSDTNHIQEQPQGPTAGQLKAVRQLEENAARCSDVAELRDMWKSANALGPAGDELKLKIQQKVKAIQDGASTTSGESGGSGTQHPDAVEQDS